MRTAGRSVPRRRPELLAGWGWTQLFVTGWLLCLLFAAAQLNWFGLIPGTSGQLIAHAPILALIGLLAVWVGPRGISVGLAATLVAIFVDQATAGVGTARLRFTPPSEFWLVTLPHVILTWIAFPAIAFLLSRIVPVWAEGLAVGAALLPMPFIRYGISPTVTGLLISPTPGQFLVLPVPWTPLILSVTALALVLSVAARRWRAQAARTAVAGVALSVLVVPLLQLVLEDQQARDAVYVRPASGGPLTEISVDAIFARPGEPLLLWDGVRVVRDIALEPLGSGVTSRASMVFFPPVAEPGDHQVVVATPSEQRTGSFRVLAPGGLWIELDTERRLVVRGPAGGRLRVLISGDDGPELLETSLDARGLWRSDRSVPSTAARALAQSGDAWEQFDLRR